MLLLCNLDLNFILIIIIWVSILSSFALLVHPLCNTVLFIYCLWYHCCIANKLKLKLNKDGLKSFLFQEYGPILPKILFLEHEYAYKTKFYSNITHNRRPTNMFLPEMIAIRNWLVVLNQSRTRNPLMMICEYGFPNLCEYTDSFNKTYPGLMTFRDKTSDDHDDTHNEQGEQYDWSNAKHQHVNQTDCLVLIAWSFETTLYETNCALHCCTVVYKRKYKT